VSKTYKAWRRKKIKTASLQSGKWHYQFVPDVKSNAFANILMLSYPVSHYTTTLGYLTKRTGLTWAIPSAPYDKKSPCPPEKLTELNEDMIFLGVTKGPRKLVESLKKSTRNLAIFYNKQFTIGIFLCIYRTYILCTMQRNSKEFRTRQKHRGVVT
jgi:hypothetical protein